MLFLGVFYVVRLEKFKLALIHVFHFCFCFLKVDYDIQCRNAELYDLCNVYCTVMIYF